MMDFIKRNKFATILAACTLVFYLWAQAGSFKLLKPEYGTKYAPNTTHGSVHHK